MGERAKRGMARRKFLTAAAATGGIVFIKPQSVTGTQANSAIEMGIIGCGGRGLFIGDLAHKNTQIKIVALADPFEDRLDRGSTRLGIDAKRRHRGVEAYQELIASKLDAVAVESPPYYHPRQAMAAVKAGKHVFLAKPVAVDAPGCKIIMEAGQMARGKQSFLVDFQTRNTDFYIEAAKRVHEGAIGKPVTGQVYYQAGRLGTQADPKDASDAARLRNWVFDKALSGDIIVEQNVHVIDVANWFLQSHPVKAFGTGGRKARIDVGDCWDHFIVTYWYPNDVLVDFSSGQFLRGYQDLCARIYGTMGTVDSHYEGKVTITGNNPYEGGSTQGIYNGGAIRNLKIFEESIRTGRYFNNTEESVASTLTAVLGRKAAYEGRMVTWDEMISDTMEMKADLNP